MSSCVWYCIVMWYNYVCVCICMYVCVCMFVYLCVYMCVYVCMYVWVCVCVYECMCVFVYVCVCICMYVYKLCMYAWMKGQTQTHTHTHTHIYIYIYVPNMHLRSFQPSSKLAHKSWPIYLVKYTVFTMLLCLRSLFNSAEKVYFRWERSAGVFQHGARYCPDHHNVCSATTALRWNRWSWRGKCITLLRGHRR